MINVFTVMGIISMIAFKKKVVGGDDEACNQKILRYTQINNHT